MEKRKRRSTCLVVALVVVILLLAAVCYFAFRIFNWDLAFLTPESPIETAGYLETFDSADTWMAGEGANASGLVINGVYEMTISDETFDDQFWAAGGRNFSDGSFEIEATPIEGALDNGYGLIIRVNRESDEFYIFKISSDGYVFIGLCTKNCSNQQALVDRDWFESQAIKTGFETTNVLRIEAMGPDMIFFVNDQEVGRAFDSTLENGDVGIFGETFAPGGLKVVFDNFIFAPIEE